MGYSTLFEYIISDVDKKYHKILEAKADIEHERHFSDIPKDIFDQIVLMDPKTMTSGNEIGPIGFGSKQLLLPKYQGGEQDFVNTPEAVTTALSSYYANIASYPKFQEFRSVADFLRFMENPQTAEIEKSTQSVHLSPLDKIYNKYYSDIEREVFDKIIAMDSKTTDSGIGEVAKNLLLVAYQRGERDFIDNNTEVASAIEKFYKKGTNYPNGKDNIQNYESVEEFISYVPTSPTAAAAVAERNVVPGRDFELLASSANYDLFKILTWEGSKAIAHARGGTNGWCTAGGSDETQWIDSSDGVGTYYKQYQPNGSKHTQLYEIISKHHPDLRPYNYNLALNVSDGTVFEFRDGDNIHGKGGFREKGAKLLNDVLLADPELLEEILTCSESLLRTCPTILAAQKIHSIVSGHFTVDSKQDWSELFADTEYLIALRASTKEVIIKNVEEIPYGAFAEFAALDNVMIGDGVKKISAQSFKNCLNLKTIAFPESLEEIGMEAFAGCTKLRGSIRIPDSVIKIGRRAFAETHCRLKINKSRTTKLKMNPKDMDWIKTHVQSIIVQ